METGYTQKLIEKGQTLEEFVLTCARAFVRDEEAYKDTDGDSPCIERNAEIVAKYWEYIEEINSYDPMKRAAFGMELKMSRMSELQISRAEAELESGRVCEMREQILNWNPPAQYDSLRDFILMQTDVGTSTSWVINKINTLQAMTLDEVVEVELTDAYHSLKVHQGLLLKAINTLRIQREWVRGLRNEFSSKECHNG